MSGDESGCGSPCYEDGMPQTTCEETPVVRNAERDGLVERCAKLSPRIVARPPEGDQLGDHRVVVRRHFPARLQRVLDAHPIRHPPQPQASALRHEAGLGILCAQPHFDGVALEAHFMLLERQRLTRSDPQLQFHQIETGDGLGDGMLNLETGVHLHEVVMNLGAFRIEQELQRARTLVANGERGLDCHRAHLRTQ